MAYVVLGKDLDAVDVAAEENMRAYARSFNIEAPELTMVVPRKVPTLPR
jgi:hypothetical protein